MNPNRKDIPKNSVREDLGRQGVALFTDLYELTMLQAYFEEEMADIAVFSLFVRRLPVRRNFLLACGLDTALEFLEDFRFSDDDLAYLASTGKFSDRFLVWLQDFHFMGDVYAVPEGTPVFANEPILEVVAPLPQAQVVETFLMNQIHLQTMLASKAQRVVTAAQGRPVIDFGSRRIHGLDAALKAARAFYIGGVSATSNVLAGKQYDLPIAGTMAHSYIQVHGDEASAFRAFAGLYPDTVLLVDTYDTLAGVRNVVDLATSPGGNFAIKAIRLDSGDLSSLSRQARRILDEAALDKVEIFVSGGLEENAIAELVSADAPIDGFGVGTEMGVSSDAPSLDIVYKLCEYAGRGRLKLSSGKPVLPGRKQLFRIGEGEEDVRDVIARADEGAPDHPGARPLLVQVMKAGNRLPEGGRIDLESARGYAEEQASRLPPRIRALAPANPPYPVAVSRTLSGLQKALAKQIRSA
uniref:Nicotinate phosphoribosyltransferase n=1 Tax=Candidatus Kentrum eta TaxID=2126337 RepID=A0A450UFW3_9GAMM|nr:MAG: nicotinate phosphoribosyltransferase [Candidatus Kentron sp. H]VFJ91384.1 MAG: nicotinate phosphoribosyltransferase [Candidatus Kentron sp. H]VFJ98035.1 MAG: nicotinate phosphoribosyltransferase [Candidatus Kentron sp. H]